MQHQKESLSWLLDQHTKGFGSVLADEMGLGKTISAIALIITLKQSLPKESTGPILIVCPATVIKQWEQEIQLWTNEASFDGKVFTFTRGGSDMVSKADKQAIVKSVFRE